MNTQDLSSKLQITYRKLVDFRKTNSDKSKQRDLADQTISCLGREIKSAYLNNAFVNNNIQSKSDAIKNLRQKVNQLQRINNNHSNKKTVHDLKKVKSDLSQVQNFSNQWINFTGNGKSKQLNLKTLINAVQELEEYL